MASVKISGVLKDGTGKPIQNGTIQLEARRHSATVLASTVASVRTDETGRYSMDVEYGQYSVTLLIDGYPPSYTGDITVYEDSQPGALNDFLLKFTEQNARPEVMIRLEELVSHARANAEAAAGYAESVKKIFDSIRTMDATTTQKGLVQLSSETESDSETLAATPRAVRAAYKLADGKYTAEDASTEQKGIVQLSSDTDSGAETFAATPKAVKEVMDETQKKAPLDSPDFTGNPRSPTPPLDASGNEIANAAFVRALIAELSGGREGDPLTVNHMQLQTGHKSSEPLVVKDMQLQSGYKSSEPLRVNHVQLQSGHKGTEPLTVNSLQLQRGHMSREPLLINHAGVHFAVVSAF